MLLCAVSAAGQENLSSRSEEGYAPTWESLDQHPLAPWWSDAKFGIYVHWSLASVPAWGNHSSFYWPNLIKSRQMEANGPRPATNDIREEYVGLWQFHQHTYGPEFKFEDFAPLFRAEAFDPEQWADLFARAGAKYVMLTTKHHDGFCLWPSAEASRTWGRPWNAAEIGPRHENYYSARELVLTFIRVAIRSRY
jgi:alpha-L-fucosidase